jgi:hypothetical protein
MFTYNIPIVIEMNKVNKIQKVDTLRTSLSQCI